MCLRFSNYFNSSLIASRLRTLKSSTVSRWNPCSEVKQSLMKFFKTILHSYKNIGISHRLSSSKELFQLRFWFLNASLKLAALSNGTSPEIILYPWRCISSRGEGEILKMGRSHRECFYLIYFKSQNTGFLYIFIQIKRYLFALTVYTYLCSFFLIWFGISHFI